MPYIIQHILCHIWQKSHTSWWKQNPTHLRTNATTMPISFIYYHVSRSSLCIWLSSSLLHDSLCKCSPSPEYHYNHRATVAHCSTYSFIIQQGLQRGFTSVEENWRKYVLISTKIKMNLCFHYYVSHLTKSKKEKNLIILLCNVWD